MADLVIVARQKALALGRLEDAMKVIQAGTGIVPVDLTSPMRGQPALVEKERLDRLAAWMEQVAALLAPEVSGAEATDPRKTLDGLTVAELRDYADMRGIPLSGVTKKAQIIDAILAFVPADDPDGEPADPAANPPADRADTEPEAGAEPPADTDGTDDPAEV